MFIYIKKIKSKIKLLSFWYFFFLAGIRQQKRPPTGDLLKENGSVRDPSRRFVSLARTHGPIAGTAVFKI